MSSKVAKRLGLHLIIDRGRGGPTIYFEDSVDLSAQVIEEFNKEYP
jgi:outer membrane protein